MGSQLKGVVARMSAIPYCLGIFCLVNPAMDWRGPATGGCLILIAAWAQRQRPLSIFLRGFKNIAVDEFLVKATLVLEPLTRVVWIRNDVTPNSLVKRRPLSKLGKFYISACWPLFAIGTAYYQPAPSLDILGANLGALVIGWFLMDVFRGDSAERFLAAITAALLTFAASTFSDPIDIPLWPGAAHYVSQSLLALATAPLLYPLLVQPIRWIGNTLGLPTFRDRYISNPEDKMHLLKELSNARGGFPFLHQRFIQNAPVLGYQIGCRDSLWEETVSAAILQFDLAVIDVTDLRPESGLEREILRCIEVKCPIVLTYNSAAESTVLEQAQNLLLAGQFVPVVPWEVSDRGHIRFDANRLWNCAQWQLHSRSQ